MTDQLPNIPLTRFLTNPGRFLDLALTAPVTLTKQSRTHWKIAEAEYFNRLEELAARYVLSALNRKQLLSADLSENMAAKIAAQMPTAEEIAQDRWNDE